MFRSPELRNGEKADKAGIDIPLRLRDVFFLNFEPYRISQILVKPAQDRNQIVSPDVQLTNDNDKSTRWEYFSGNFTVEKLLSEILKRGYKKSNVNQHPPQQPRRFLDRF